MTNKKHYLNKIVKKAGKVFKSLSGNEFFKVSKHAVKGMALFAVIGAVGSLELNQISAQHALMQAVSAAIIMSV